MRRLEPSYSLAEMKERLVYMALFKAYCDEDTAPAYLYEIERLLERGHCKVDRGIVTITPTGIAHWVNMVTGDWQSLQPISAQIRAVLRGDDPKLIKTNNIEKRKVKKPNHAK